MMSYLGEAAQTYVGGDGSVLRSYAGKSPAAYESLCVFLEAMGYLCYDSHQENGSLFATYTKGEELYHLYWLADTERLSTVTSTSAGGTLPNVPPVTVGTQVITLTQMCLPLTAENVYSNGMGYVVRLADGSFLIFDGGYAEQADQLWQLLTAQNGGENGIVIRAWLLTHAHSDHYSCLSAFSAQYADRVTVERFLIAALNRADAADSFLHTSFPTIAARFAGAKVCTVHTGMRFSFCGLSMEILLAPDELYINGRISDFNNSSIVCRLRNDLDSFLILGDAMCEVTDRLTAVYGDTLRANQCQVAHHGVGNSSAEFYESLQPSTLWYPCGHRLYDWDVAFADNIRRNGAVRQALAEAGVYEILLHDVAAWIKVWGSPAAAQEFQAVSVSPENDEYILPEAERKLFIEFYGSGSLNSTDALECGKAAVGVFHRQISLAMEDHFDSPSSSASAFERRPNAVVVELGVNDCSGTPQSGSKNDQNRITTLVNDIRARYGGNMPVVWVCGCLDNSVAWRQNAKAVLAAMDGNPYDYRVSPVAAKADFNHPQASPAANMAEDVAAYLNKIMLGGAEDESAPPVDPRPGDWLAIIPDCLYQNHISGTSVSRSSEKEGIKP